MKLSLVRRYLPGQETISGLVRAYLLFNIVADAEAVRICDGCPGSLNEAMCDSQVSDRQVSLLLLGRVLAAGDRKSGDP